uniref:Kynurenine formamidase n=1 Tax=Candidatus Kentrum sp. TUN TaxID=2126343 RepID=A0A451ADR8_9GAMM|nr:MAG: Kynurenine formamidase [Candidatus Kentron sp. TUN]
MAEADLVSTGIPRSVGDPSPDVAPSRKFLMVMFYDISPLIDEKLAVWPGDTPLRRDVILDRTRGDTVTLSALTATVHLGAHTDAPSHYGAGAPTMEARDPALYVGRCQVMRVPVERKTRILPENLTAPIRAERVLFATGTYPDPTVFNEDFAALSPELIDRLHAEGVKLVGIDTPSIDLFDSKGLPTHHACLRRDMTPLEGLVLDRVPEGIYELIALPLKLAGFDASPVRAVLRTSSGIPE